MKHRYTATFNVDEEFFNGEDVERLRNATEMALEEYVIYNAKVMMEDGYCIRRNDRNTRGILWPQGLSQNQIRKMKIKKIAKGDSYESHYHLPAVGIADRGWREEI